MIQYMYAMKDDLAGSFAMYGDFVNDEVAMRNFKMACSAPNVPIADLSLYRLGEFDTKTGRIDNIQLEFICRGEKYEKE